MDWGLGRSRPHSRVSTPPYIERIEVDRAPRRPSELGVSRHHEAVSVEPDFPGLFPASPHPTRGGKPG